MSIITNYKNKIHTSYFNPKIYYGTMSNKEKASRQNKKYYAKYKYLENKNKHRKVLLVTFTSKSKDINIIQKIKTKFLSFLKNDKNIKGCYSYIWSIELGKNKNNPHLHCMIWYDEKSYNRIHLHYEKTLKKFNLIKKWSKLTEQRKVAAYILKEFSVFNKSFEDYYVARRAISQKNKKTIRFIGFSSFEHTDKLYKKSYDLYQYDYLKTDKMFNFGELIFWDKQYLVKNSELDTSVIYLLLNYKNTAQKDMLYLCLNCQYSNLFFTLTIKLNKRVLIAREWQFPIVFIFL